MLELLLIKWRGAYNETQCFKLIHVDRLYGERKVSMWANIEDKKPEAELKEEFDT
jgi:hypothetical protein